MSMIDKALSSNSPAMSEAAQTESTRRARWAASPGDWLSLALDHHLEIRQCFDACREAAGRPARLAAMKRLALVLSAHSMAEELVLYPALARTGKKLEAGHAYAEQTAEKLQMAALELVDPSTESWLDKLEQIRDAVLHHMHEEERSWFLDLKEKAEDQGYLTLRFREEFERRAAPSPAPTAEPRSFAPTQPTAGELDRH